MNRCRILLGLTISLMALPATTCAASGQSTELTYADGQKALVVLPEDYDPDRQYPCVCFMPQDGYSNQAYLEDGTLDRIRDLETDGDMEEMIFVFPGYQKGEDLFDQTEELLKAVEEELPVSREPSKRGVIGTGAGGYMAFLLTYVSSGGEILKEPEFFSAAASHDGDFVSGDNPYLEEYGSICGILKEKISSFGADTQWLRNYYTYLDCSLGTEHSWAEGGSCDIASLYRNAGLSDENSPQAWDYSVFEYVIQDPVRYGSWTDHLERSLKGFSQAFFTEEATREMPEETEKPYTAMETVSVGEDRRIDLMGDWYFCTADAVEKQNPGIDASSAGEILAVDWSAWDVVQPGLDWWTEDFAACLNRNPYYAGYAWYVREFEVPEEFDRTCLQIEAGMMDEGDEVYINGERVGQTGIPDEGGRYDGTNPWDVERVYGIPDRLLKAGTNTIAVRVANGSGAGGWYAGPILIEAKKAAAESPDGEKQRFYPASFRSDALNGQTIEYRVYLPEGYYDSNLRYPVVYMLHGYGSTGKSFEIAGVPELLDEGIASGEIPPCIVIFPTDGHPQKASWWSGAYAVMLNEDLVREVDSSLRTVDSRDCRFLAGESMGGGGAYLNALNHPELYGGVLDMYGALRYTGALQPFLEMDAEHLGAFRHCIICGSHDMYCFDLDHIMMGKHLAKTGVSFRFDIDNGEHSSDFYMPRLKESLCWLLEGAEPKKD